jgi:hypothetical protein
MTVSSEPRIDTADLSNLVIAARLGLQFLRGQDLVNVSLSIARTEQALTQAKPAEQPAEKPA